MTGRERSQIAFESRETPKTGEPATAGMNPPDAPCSMRLSSVCFLQFHVIWTLSSKLFLTFPHGTCRLSVSCSVFSLGWNSPPVLGLRSQTTRLLENVRPTYWGPARQDYHPLWLRVIRSLVYVGFRKLTEAHRGTRKPSFWSGPDPSSNLRTVPPVGPNSILHNATSPPQTPWCITVGNITFSAWQYAGYYEGRQGDTVTAPRNR